MRLAITYTRTIILGLATAWLAGTVLSADFAWPFLLLREARNLILDATLPQPTAQQPIVFDRFGRLSGYYGKELAPCPRQDARTAVLLVIGQSNSANTGEGTQASAHGSRIVNLFQGNCYRGDSPLLGAAGADGEAWTLLANRLVSAGRYEQVVLVASGINGSRIARWQPGGDLNRMLMRVLDAAQAQYKITHVLWHQGEADYDLGTSEEAYRRMFLALVSDLRARGIAAPVFVSVASRCNVREERLTDNAIARAQRSLPDPARNIRAGPDTDALLGTSRRRDGCHFNTAGLEVAAAAWEAAFVDSAPQFRSAR